MPSFEIPDGPTIIALAPETPSDPSIGSGTASFSVTNRAAQGLAGRLSVIPQGDARAEWFVLQGENERRFAIGETQTATVSVRPPAGTAPGTYRFRLRAVNVNDPDNDFTESAVSGFEIKPAAPPKPFPWWAVAVAAGLVVVIGGLAAAYFILFSGGPVMPRVAEMAVPQATQALNDIALDLVVVAENRDPAGRDPGTVIDQNPAAGESLTRGQTVTLYVDPGVAVPALTGVSLTAAAQRINSARLTVGSVTTKAQAGTVGDVVSQAVAPNTMVAKDSRIDLVVRTAPCRSIPGRPSLCFDDRVFSFRDFQAQRETILNPGLVPSP